MDVSYIIIFGFNNLVFVFLSRDPFQISCHLLVPNELNFFLFLRILFYIIRTDLPGDLFGLMYFYAIVFLVYFAILLWYGVTMKMFEDANIPIQSWIFGTICMGTLEVFFRSGDLFVWNEDGSRFWVAYYVGKCIS
jgi:hypothetical protein